MKILTLDSGLDICGYAVFELNQYRAAPGSLPDTARALKAVVATSELVTSPSDPMDVRVASLARQMRDNVIEHCPVAVYVEVPRYAGRSAGVGLERQADVAKLYQAIGAIEVGIHWGYGTMTIKPALFEVAASRQPKPARHELLEMWAKAANYTMPRGVRGGAKPDVWDALWIGVDVLTSRVERDLRTLKEAIPA